MSKVYIGNLSLEVTEEELRSLFEQKAGIIAQDISLKDGFAFVDVENNDLVEQAIEKLNGKRLSQFMYVVYYIFFQSLCCKCCVEFEDIIRVKCSVHDTGLCRTPMCYAHGFV